MRTIQRDIATLESQFPLICDTEGRTNHLSWDRDHRGLEVPRLEAPTRWSCAGGFWVSAARRKHWRARDAEGIRTLLMRRFTNVVADEVLITRRYTPAELWSWFEEGYDLDDFPPREASAMRTGYLNELFPLCEPDGRIEFTNRLCQVRAVAV